MSLKNKNVFVQTFKKETCKSKEQTSKKKEGLYEF